MMMDRNLKFSILAWSQAPETSLLLGIFVTTTSPLHKASAFALMFAHTHTNIVWDYLRAHQYLHTNELVEHFFVFSVGSKFVLFCFFSFFLIQSFTCDLFKKIISFESSIIN